MRSSRSCRIWLKRHLEVVVPPKDRREYYQETKLHRNKLPETPLEMTNIRRVTPRRKDSKQDRMDVCRSEARKVTPRIINDRADMTMLREDLASRRLQSRVIFPNRSGSPFSLPFIQPFLFIHSKWTALLPRSLHYSITAGSDVAVVVMPSPEMISRSNK